MIDAEISRAIAIEAEAAEGAAVYNLDLIRKLEKAHADTRAIAQLNERRDEQMHERIRKLENALADARRDHSDLVKLVERMGRDLDSHCMTGFAREYRYPYTIIGQREYDATMNEAEGTPPDAGMLENIQ